MAPCPGTVSTTRALGCDECSFLPSIYLSPRAGINQSYEGVPCYSLHVLLRSCVHSVDARVYTTTSPGQRMVKSVMSHGVSNDVEEATLRMPMVVSFCHGGQNTYLLAVTQISCFLDASDALDDAAVDVANLMFT
eukprot:TRINITY_DN1119_c0_g1_i1.p1 TRINITY_DN1119_c0_g1~~TRINITY_DN1119_c0_g1_i1.p1  ORF type:complete len:135 (+),score=12.69 TRINITY_DN1119_c0_g1_i1:9-413(+)